MPRSLPHHTRKPGAPRVFHNNDDCYGARRIEVEYWAAGDGGHPLCPECARL